MYKTCRQIGAVALCALAACVSETAPAPKVELSERSAALGVTGGDIPLPVKNGKVSWDGTYAELLAADALALCHISGSAGTMFFSPEPASDADKMIQYLGAKMAAASSVAPAGGGASPGLAFFLAWRTSRNEPMYNQDASTGEPRGIDLTPPVRSEDYNLPGISAMRLLMTGTPDTAPLSLTGTRAVAGMLSAQAFASYADLSLCMARRLREHLDSPVIAFASKEEVEQLYALTHERALTAVVQLSLLAKAFSATNATGDNTINNGNLALIPLRRWRDLGDTAILGRIGADFASAIGLLVETTENLANQIMRRPEANRQMGTYDASGETITGPRMDLLAMLYGQIVRSYDTPAHQKVVTVKMGEPAVQTLLGLARRADALRLTIANDSIDFAANGTTLLNAAETLLRQTDCTAMGNTAPSCWQIPAGQFFENFELWKRHRIAPEHAERLLMGFAESMFGRPQTVPTGKTWSYLLGGAGLFNSAANRARARNPGLHLLGAHSYTGTLARPSSGTIRINPAFGVAPLTQEDLQLRRTFDGFPLRSFEVHQHPKHVGMNFRAAWAPSTELLPRREMGAVPALALARESLLQLVGTTFLSNARPALELIDAAIGPRTAMIRAAQGAATGTSAAACGDWTDNGTTPTSCSLLIWSSPAAGQYNYEVAVTTRSSDTSSTIAYGNQPALGATIALDRATTTIWGTNNASLNALTRTTLASATQDGDRVLRTATIALTHNGQAGNAVYLANQRPDSSFRFEPVLVHTLGNASFPLAAVSVSYGGWLNDFAQRSWQVSKTDWSKPRYDAFGLPQDWVPMPDASLHGGSEAQDDYRYFLDLAKAAAGEATSAIDSAVGLIMNESADNAALAEAERRGKDLTQLELKGLCGAATACSFQWTLATITRPTCFTPSDTSTDHCVAVNQLLNAVIPGPGVYLPSPVVAMLPRSQPNFSQYSGGDMERGLVRVWSAWKSLQASVDTMVKAATAAQMARRAATDEWLAVNAARTEVKAEIDQAYAELAAAGLNLNAEQAQYEAAYNTIHTEFTNAKAEHERICSENMFQVARSASSSYSDDAEDLYTKVNWDPATGAVTTKVGTDHPNRYVQSVNFSPIWEWIERCTAASLSEQELDAQLRDASIVKDVRMQALDAARATRGLAERALAAKSAEVEARLHVAYANHGSVVSQGVNAIVANANLVQSAINDVFAATTEIKIAMQRANLATAKVKVEQALATHDVRTRFSLRRRFQSYDLWRARALSENARRLAVAARRAIEARFVTNLTDLSAPEPFVAAPSSWADDVYDPDLKPPAAVGLSAAPSHGSGVYSRKLTDYVNNLELFVSGFAVERPSAVAKADTDVVQIPGPAALVRSSLHGAEVSYVDPDSYGWSFRCPSGSTDEWVNPQPAGLWDIEEQLEPFEEMSGRDLGIADLICGSYPMRATHARLAFSLDPWGRVNGAINSGPYRNRYNARWERLAVNLVGSGVRNCAQAPDPARCYAEPYLPYSLRHVGPSWVTAYGGQWKTMDLPPAVVEGAKALAIEEWIDPVTHGWNLPAVAAVARHEFAARPLGGSYELILEIGPDVQIEQIERIQILTMSDYWVGQN